MYKANKRYGVLQWTRAYLRKGDTGVSHRQLQNHCLDRSSYYLARTKLSYAGEPLLAAGLEVASEKQDIPWGNKKAQNPNNTTNKQKPGPWHDLMDFEGHLLASYPARQSDHGGTPSEDLRPRCGPETPGLSWRGSAGQCTLLITGGKGGGLESGTKSDSEKGFSSDTWKGGCNLRQTAEGFTIRSTSWWSAEPIFGGSPGVEHPLSTATPFARLELYVGWPASGIPKSKEGGQHEPNLLPNNRDWYPREWFHPGSVRDTVQVDCLPSNNH